MAWRRLLTQVARQGLDLRCLVESSGRPHLAFYKVKNGNGGCSFRRREKVTGAAEILNLDEVEALQSELAFRRSVRSAGEEFAEVKEIHGAGEASEPAIGGADAGGGEEGEIEKP